MTVSSSTKDEAQPVAELVSCLDEDDSSTQEREQALLRKLDVRIIPMIMWMYLMSFMDRGKNYANTTNILRRKLSDMKGSQYRKCQTLRIGGRFGSCREPISDFSIHSLRDILR